MGLYKGYVTQKGMNILAGCKKLYNELGVRATPNKISKELNISVKYVKTLWIKFTGKTWEDDLKTKIQAYIMVYPDSSMQEVSEYMDIPTNQIVLIWSSVMNEIKSAEKEDALLKGAIQIPEFIPKAKKFISNDGKVCTDVSEFFGITEYGGDCYKNIHYTIPKGNSDIFRGSASDVYI